MRIPCMSDKYELATRLMECVSRKGMLPALHIASKEIENYKSKAREWPFFEDIIVRELSSVGILPSDEAEQYRYIIAYFLLPRLDEILEISLGDPSEWDRDTFLMRPSLDELISESVFDTFRRLEHIMDIDILNKNNLL